MDAHTLHNELLRMQRNLSHSMAEYIQAARQMTFMVKAVDLTLESMYEGRALQRAIWRYEALWMPILAALNNPPTAEDENPRKPKWRHHAFGTKVDEIRAKNFAKGGLWLDKATLVPPLDIAWVWHCHRLNPHAYAADLASFVPEGDAASVAYMQEACETTLETAFKFSDGEDAQSKPTRRLWAITFPFEAYMPKYLLSHSYDEEEVKRRQNITSFTNEITRSSFRSVLEYDLERSALLQKAFLYQIVDENGSEAGEAFETNAYLTRAYTRYLQFIALHERASEDTPFLVPMNDINIMWHMHLSCTKEYQNDCNVLIGYAVKHDSIAVDDIRKKRIAEMEVERANSGEAEQEHILEEEELAELIEKRRRGVPIKETKALWEACYGSKPRYDIPDTCYRGEPPGERGGFYEVFEKINGTRRDISWPETVSRMLFAILVFVIGLLYTTRAFFKAMMRHGRYLLEIPVGFAIIAFGLYAFLKIPISRPLSSESRYWIERSYKQTHNPLPPYLISTSKKAM